MNEDTLVAVCCYAGDAHQVVHALRMYLHHQCPVICFSPEDSRADVRYPGVERVFVGKRAYIGQESLDRQRLHFEKLLSYPHKYFLLNDSDSFCLSPEIPRILYENDSIVWSLEVVEPRPHASPYPKIAMQPPYFFSRAALEKMYAISSRVRAHEITPYIDWWMLAVCCEAGLFHRSFMSLERHAPAAHTMVHTLTSAQDHIYRIKYCGRVFIHPIKTIDTLSLSEKAYQERVL